MMKYTLEKDLPIDTIDNESEKYRLEYYSQKPKHLNDIFFKGLKKYGLFYPPIVVREDTRFSPVLGKSIIDIYRNQNIPIPYVLVITGKQNEYEIIKFLLYMKKEIQGFNIIEKSIAVKKIYEFNNELDDETLSLLEIPNNPRYRENFLKLSDASENIKDLLLQDVVHENTVFEIFKFPETTWDMLANFIKKISLGTRKRNKILNMLHDIAFKDTEVLKNIIECKEIENILKSSVDAPHKGEKVFLYIEKLRYPKIVHYKENFYKKLKEVKINKKFQIIIPENFEKWEFKVVVPFSSVNDFKKDIEDLHIISENEEFAKLMELRSD
jgi:hypothetical protein